MQKYRLSEHTRVYSYQDKGETCLVTLRQIIALHNFADVIAGDEGGWIDAEDALSQAGESWIYDPNSAVFGGARIEDNARLTRGCIVSHQAIVKDNAWLDAAEVSHHAVISDNVTIQHSTVRGECQISGEARILHQSQVIAMRGLTHEHDNILKIGDRAIVTDSRIVHQAQIYGDAVVNHAFIEHRAEIFDFAHLEGNEENNVWVCDCAKVYGHARLIAGTEEDAIPTLRYSSQVAENAVVEGNCVLKHHVLVGGEAWLRGGPILIDDNVVIQGRARVRGDVIITHFIELSGDAVIEATDGEVLCLRDHKVINGAQRITRTPLVGLL